MKIVLEKLGKFGPYQLFLYTILLVPGILAGAQTLLFTWTGYAPSARCRVPKYDNDSAVGGGDGDFNKPFRENLTWMLFAGSEKQRGVPVYCLYCPERSRARFDAKPCTLDRGAIKCDHGYIYDRSVMRSSLTMELDMVCDGADNVNYVRSVFMSGFLVGAGFFGTMADRFGRRPVFLLCALADAIVYLTAWLYMDLWFPLFLIVQFLLGALQHGCFILGYTVFMELVGGRFRTLCGIWYQGFFTIGMLYVSLVAYIFRDWRLTHIFVGIPFVLYLPFYWIFPESIRWSITTDRKDIAEKMITRAAKMNRVTVDAKQLIEAEQQELEEERKKTASVVDLFRGWHLAKVTLIVFYTWLAVSMNFYGLSLNTADLPVDPFVSYVISAAIEFPGYLFCVPLMNVAGRKVGLVLLMSGGGIACILAGLAPLDQWMIVALAMTGKMCAAAAFALIYNYSAEVFPTVARTTGIGWSSLFARVGSMSAPLIHNLALNVAEWLPIVVYGAFAVFAGFLDCFLPETLHRDLPETIEDGVEFCRGKVKPKSKINGKTSQPPEQLQPCVAVLNPSTTAQPVANCETKM